MTLNLHIKKVIITLLLSLSFIISFGQIELVRDTVSNSNGNERNQRFRSDFDNGKQTPSVFFDIAKLNKLLQASTAAGQSKIEFVFSTIRKEDTARYVRNRNLQFTTEQRNQLVNRPIVLIKVPRTALDFMATKNNNNVQQFITAMLALGYIKADQPYNIIYDGSIYFDIGVVCPPPSDCFNLP